jgi:hypothetical protein
MQTGARQAVAADRAIKAWHARVLGMDWAAAARYAGYADAATACRGVHNFFGKLPQIDTDERRRLWQDRLEYLWRNVVHELQETPAGRNAGNLRAATAIAQRAAALDGLDQPSRLEVYRPDDAEKIAVVAALRRQALESAGVPAEGDPFEDAVIVKDDENPV